MKKLILRKTSSLFQKYRFQITFVLKLLFVFGLLYFLVKKGFISVSATRQAMGDWPRILPAAGALFFTCLLGAVRWRWLLMAQDIHLGWKKTLQLTLIGNFFNIALPGAVSGDFVKAFYVGKEIKGQRGRAFGSILFDRVAGLSALVFVSAGALILGLRSYRDSPLFNAIQFMIEFAAAATILFYGYLFLVSERKDPLLRIFRTLEKRLPKCATFTRLYLSLRHYHDHRMTVVKVLIVSVMIHLTVGFCFLTFAQTLGDMNLPLLSVYIVVPLGLLVTAIPVAPGGVGTGNIAFLYFFHLIGSDRGADAYSIYAMINILLSCIGGIVYLRFRTHDQLPSIDSLPATAM